MCAIRTCGVYPVCIDFLTQHVDWGYSAGMAYRFPFNADPAYLDRQHNNRLRVPDFLIRYMQGWQRSSAQVRAQQACLLDVPYGPAPAENLDIFPAGGRAQPVLVFIHGGYWRRLDKADHSFVAPAFTQQGVCVVVPNYALCGATSSTTIDDIALQMVRCVAWVYRHIDQYGGDPDCITVAGHSAGGHLAAMLAACEWERWDAALPKQLVRNAMGISGLYDLAPVMHSPYLQTDIHLTPAQVQRNSPAYFSEPRAPLVAVCGGDESDEFLRHNQLIETAWGTRHVPVREAMLGCNHFSIVEKLVDPQHRVHRLAQQLLGI
jgi:arylformamidase